ncbi:MAG: S-adenosylmethionine:tRNA ribosyltransferase-isomerase [Bacteroidales bacterium]|jgi:S-adenosylmethionine:tRNA ribosyltransferase-isomerase|nr:S-adenosylmethionine:tRNA ribosyltransferase-isomerase [Bacteroidales bacterium]MCK9498268.1 S-adenosylmethionine:tRNA ribosyltransferase-isomerase [Bacteroidales bacterium]
MKDYKQININNYYYDLPESKIAKYPKEKRDESKLLIKNKDSITKNIFKNISDYLPADSLMLFNNTKVINARLFFKKDTGATIEVFCLEPINPIDYSLSLSASKQCTWKCLIGNNKKWKTGNLKKTISINSKNFELVIEKKQKLGNAFEIEFTWDNENIIFSQILENSGKIPIPPYLNRESENIDNQRYQTIYSYEQGSVAAPTAGLHFTESVFQKLKEKNIKTDNITLHVGAGTFQPVKTEFVNEHKMHTEYFSVSKSNIQNLLSNLGKIIVVGTTSVRTLESLYQIALQLYYNNTKKDNYFGISQWEAYQEVQKNISTNILLNNMLNWMENNNFEQIHCSTSIMIVPSYKFRLTNHLITNFHQPKSTLLLLLSAFIGESWKKVYEFALIEDFKFLSYGDSCLFL